MITAAPKSTMEADAGVLELDRLLAQLSASLISLSADRVDHTFRGALRRVGESIAIDCGTHCLFDAGGLVIQTEWRHPGIPPQASLVPDQKRFPWTHAELRRGVATSFSCIDEIPHPVDRQSFAASALPRSARRTL